MKESVTISKEKNWSAPAERPALLLEYLPDYPHFALQEVFDNFSHCKRLKGYLNQWLEEDFAIEPTVEEAGPTPGTVKGFYESLLKLIEALKIVNEQPGIIHIPSEHASIVLSNFCESYSPVYVRRELWCFLHSTIDRAFQYSDTFLPGAALDYYEQLSALTESAYIIYAESKREQ